MKKGTQLLVTVCLLLVSGLEGFSQDITNRGRDFWVGYGHHQYMEPGQPNSQEMVLYFSAEQAANVTVTAKGRTATQVTNYFVPANSVIASNFMPKAGPNDVRLYDVPPTFGGNGGEGLFGMSVHIESDVPIVAYAHIFGSVSSGATMLMPVESWGYSFMSINSQQVDAAGPAFSWVYAIAQHDNTVIEVTPSVPTRLGKPAGVPFTVTLQRGEIYQFIGQSDGNGNGNQFTGSTVKSIANPAGECYPIAVFSGCSRTRGESVPCGTNSGRDNDMQQCFPTQAWGKRYLTAPFSTASGPSANVTLNASTFQTSVYKIVVKDPTTVVRRNGVPLGGLILGKYYQFSSNTADLIESDKPIMIAQFMSGASGCNPGSWGDPEMVFLSPIEQAINRVGFYRNTRQSIYANYVTVIIPTAGVASLRIDGSAVFNHTYPHPNLAGYSVVVKGWQAAQAQTIMQSDSSFTAITYGLGSAESYAYNAGTYLKNLNAVSSIQNTPDPSVQEHPFTCVGTPINLSVLMAYQPTRMEWLLSQLGLVITPNADVIDNAPVSAGIVLVNGVPYYKYTLPGTYVFNVADTFDIPINTFHPSIENCYNRENLKVPVIVKEKPIADFSISHTGCTLDPVTLTGATPTSNGYTVNGFNWTLPGPSTATGQTITQIFPPGVHAVNLSVVTADGCASDTTKNITVVDKPLSDFEVVPGNLCEGQSFTITDTASSAIAVTSWYWDFGNGVTQTVTTGPSVTYTYPLPGTYEIKHVASSSASCISDTARRTVTVYARPTVSFTNDANGCIDPSGVVNFSGTATTPDGQTINTYAWVFNDPNASPPNPNTSALQNPSHIFQQGTYTIQFTATTANGCTNTINQTLTFNIEPALAYPALTAVCENDAPLSVATASVTNGVPGSGTYSGPGTTAAGIFDPSVAGYGTHTITYTYTSTGGCTETITQDILVHARPRTAFTLPAAGCLPTNGLVNFTNTSTIPDAQTMTWLWTFNDPNASAPNPNTSTAQHASHMFQEGTYPINLQATSDNGCIKDTTITATFSVTPSLSYTALPAICENAAPVSVAMATVTNGITGTGTYSGPGTNAAGMFNPAIAGWGMHTITYSFTSTGGCTETITQNILVHARPRTEFTIPAAGCLPANGLVNFTNTTTIPDAQTMTWLWTFNDPNASAPNPNTSTAQHASHMFLDGTYPINLQATSSNGCIKDTTITATFSVTPVLNYSTIPAICESAAPVSVANASVTNGVPGTGTYSGPGTNAAGLFDPAVAGYGTHTITYTFTSTGGCTQTITQDVLVHARPRTNFTLPAAGCLPPNGLVNFTNTSTIPDAQTMTWLWTFNDPNASAPNPNTSTAQHASHLFQEGTYPVNLQATSSNGCIKDTTINATFAVTPALLYPALTGICQNPGAPQISVAAASVTNGITGTGVYSGPGTTAAGMFDPNVAGPGVHTITYTFTSAGGCTETITSTIEVYPRPTALFTVDAGACLGQSVTITPSSSIPSGAITNWNWNLGDGNTPTYTNGNPFNVTYAATGNYNVQLVNISDQGCISEPVSLPVRVSPLPTVDFTVPAGICMPGGSAGFTNGTTVADNSALTYQWDFGDGNNSTATNPTHVYAATGSYNVTLTATSAFGCVNQLTQTIDDFFDKPVASFAVDPQELCQGQSNTFTDGSSAPNSTLQSWAWNFDDGTNSTSQHPSKTFSQPGIYNVTLVVTNAVGCVSDPFILPVTVHLQPVIDAGSSYVLPQGNTVTLNATANSPSLIFQWSPAIGLSNPNILNPVLTAIADQTYTLTATNSFGCIATDEISVKILKPVKVPNVFSPNGDNIHDQWIIPNLGDYPGATVEVFNRYGQQVYYSAGYGTPWNGTYRGKEMPVGTYYYVIQLQNGFKPLTGSVTIIR